MVSEWQQAFLTDLYEIGSGLSKPAEDFGSGYPFLAFKDVFNNVFVPAELEQLVQSNEKEQQKCSVLRGDVFLTRTSETMNELGMSSVALKDYPQATFNGFTKRLRPKEGNSLVPEYVAYYLRSPAFRTKMLAFSTMSTRASLNNEMIGRLTIDFPNPEVQFRIAAVLKAFDDKIALNCQINTTLESMAQALFKSWFVDFDPVIDNALAAGNEIPDELAARAARREALRQQTSKTTNKTTGATGAVSVEQALPETGLSDQRLPPEIQQLFPDRFVLTEEMGWVPEGWEVDQLSSYINVKHGFAFKGEYFSDKETSDVLLTPGNIAIGGGYKGDKLKFYEGPIDSEYILQEGDLILTMTDLSKQADTLGYPALVPFDEEKRYLHNQRLGKVELKKEVFGFGWLYYFFCSQAYRDEILSGMSGTTVKHTSPKKIMANKIVTPEKALLQNFEKTVSALLRKKSLLLQENKTLSNLRDSLLPKLLSGQITIPDAEQQLAEVL